MTTLLLCVQYEKLNEIRIEFYNEISVFNNILAAVIVCAIAQ